MVYRGHVKDGAVVLDEPVALPEGAEVEVDIVSVPKEGTTLGERMMKYAGCIKGLPADFSVNHDHYLYGTPKK